MKRTIILGLLLFFGSLAGMPLAHDSGKEAPPDPGIVYGEKLGTVVLPFRCGKSADDHAQRGLALLHNMTYVGARAEFVAAIEAAPDCALGYWGQAMTYIHPLWSDPPGEEDFKRGKALADKAASLAKSDHERAYAGAVTAYYEAGRNRTEAPNLKAFAEGWRKVHERFPDDPEATAFYALANLGTASAADKSYAKQKQSAELAKGILKRIPDHPGAHHYTIHALDYPPLAADALEVARSYGEIAPAVPHALHMPAHIFTRLGLWPESIEMNRRSADAALKHPADGKISLHYLHALDYLAYAYLQRGEDDKAKQIMDEMMALEGPYQTHVASAYTFAAIPARLALERQQWAAAATLESRTPADYPWAVNPAMEAITYFARGIGAARSGDAKTARQAIEKLTALESETRESSAYWAQQVEIQRLSVEAWLAYLKGDKKKALSTMRQAAAQEASTEKHPVTPGEVLPAHELLADMLLEMKRYEQARQNYVAALERSPNRLNSLFGAARSSDLVGDKEQAAMYYGKLLDVVAPDCDLKRVREARVYLAGR